MTTKPENIDTSAERVHKNLIAELMREAAEYIDSVTLDSDQVSPVYHELRQAAHDIEQQEPVAWIVTGPYEKRAFAYKETVEEYCAGLNMGYGEKAHKIMELYAAPRPAEQKHAEQKPVHQRCEYCDGTGDVHSIDGEWRGACDCQQPAPDVSALVDALEASTHRLHEPADGEDDCRCSQCCFVRLRDAALAAYRKGDVV